jgi:hypothetical protein
LSRRLNKQIEIDVQIGETARQKTLKRQLDTGRRHLMSLMEEKKRKYIGIENKMRSR